MPQITLDLLDQEYSMEARALRRSVTSAMHPDVYMTDTYIHDIVTTFRETANCTLEDVREALSVLIVFGKAEFTNRGRFKLVARNEL